MTQKKKADIMKDTVKELTKQTEIKTLSLYNISLSSFYNVTINLLTIQQHVSNYFSTSHTCTLLTNSTTAAWKTQQLRRYRVHAIQSLIANESILLTICFFHQYSTWKVLQNNVPKDSIWLHHHAWSLLHLRLIRYTSFVSYNLTHYFSYIFFCRCCSQL